MAANTASLNMIISIFRDLSVRSKLINDFGFGNTFDLNAKVDIKYPILWVEPTQSRAKNSGPATGYRELLYGFNVYILDRINKGDSNYQELLSDTQYSLSTIVAEIEQHVYYINNNMSLVEDILYNPVTYEYDDNVNGYQAQLKIKVPLRYTPCLAPIAPITGYTFSLAASVAEFRLVGPQGVQGPQGVDGPQGIQGIGDRGFQGVQGPGVGEIGSQGPQGFVGNQGSFGPQGVDGSNGSDGVQGSQGPIGFQGSVGAQGNAGQIGTTGVQGNQGNTGAQGPQGNVGLQGNKGDVGVQGNTGTAGLQGSQGPIGQTGTTGVQGTQGNIGSQGVQGTQGNIGVTGAIGATGSQGPIGSQGNVGNQGFQGLIGTTGTTGVVGATGNQGSQGNIGFQGFQGRQGFQGLIGFQGAQGNQGLIGVTGSVGVTGSQGNQGLVGVTGNTGTQGSQGNQGNVGINGSTGSVGAQGPQGNTGSQGLIGVTGAQGVQGNVGAQGNQGLIGVTGSVGPQGNTGTTGTTGAQGPQGLIGVTGLQGNTGFQGFQGDKGATGSQGNTGFQGNQGNIGLTGITGATGSNGTNGNQGSQGPIGVIGTTGAQGNQGLIGVTGVQGVQGTQGSQGLIGVTGSTGSVGPQGVIGTTGAQGNQGFQGLIGTTGTTGAVGATGSQGNIGVTGLQGFQGNQGSIGSTGSVGLQGFQGRQGFQGLIGFQGNQGNQGNIGSTGSQGLIGLTGVQGSQGNQGNIGFQGNIGVVGATGSNGTNGNQGSQGPIGVTGTTGNQGSQGNIGSTGSVGPQGVIGTTGAQGNQGLIGVTGSQGFQGPIGFQGNQGSQGNIGFQGFQGDKGATGSQGFQGWQGVIGFQGNIGTTGTTGLQGRQGFQGPIGFQGNQGSQGNIGIGSTGPTGPAVANAFIQNGNSFGGTATLGTNDLNALQFETNNNKVMTLSTRGNVIIGSTADAGNGVLQVNGNIMPSIGSVYTLGSGGDFWSNVYSVQANFFNTYTSNLYNSGNITGLNTTGTYSIVGTPTHTIPFIETEFIDLHPESTNVVLPFITNDLAYLTLRGGSCTASATTSNTQFATMFNGAPDYVFFDPTTFTSGQYVISITFDVPYFYSSTIGFSFGNAGWRAGDFTIELNVNGTYQFADSKTGWQLGNYALVVNPAGTGILGMRITFSNFANTGSTGFRIAQIFLLNYNSQLAKATLLARDGGTFYNQIIANNGTQSSLPPFSDVNNNGVFFPTSNSVGFSVAGTEVGRFTPTTFTTSNDLIISNNSLGVGVSGSQAITLVNNTLAATASQQISPSILWQGSGWATTPSLPKVVQFQALVLPVQSTTEPTSIWELQSSIDGAAQTNPLTVTSAGAVTALVSLSTTQLVVSAANSNIFIPSTVAAINEASTPQFNYAGVSSGTALRVGFYGSTTTVLTANDNYGQVIFGTAPITEATSGTHSWLSQVVMNGIGTVTNGVAVTQNSTTLYLSQGATGLTTSTNYTLYSATGSNYFGGQIQPSTIQTTVNASTSGSVIFTQPFTGASYKKVMIYCNAALGTATYTFPIPFLFTPVTNTTSGPAASVVTSLSTTAVTVTGATTTGFIIVEGF